MHGQNSWVVIFPILGTMAPEEIPALCVSGSKILNCMISPKVLREGSRVSIVAPASPFKADEVEVGLDIVREMGLEPVLGNNVKYLRTQGAHAASVGERVEELMQAFSDPNTSAVITVLGGMGSAALLPYLDYDIISRSRKAFLGMSDITSLNLGILTCAGLITINGQYPSIRIDEGRSLMESDSESLRFTLELMMSTEKWNERPLEISHTIPRTVRSGFARGIAIGCNLHSMQCLLGTGYFPNTQNSVLFIEDVHKDGESIERELIHLQMAGALDNIAGAVVGTFSDVPRKIKDDVPSIEDVVQTYLSDYPCSYGYAFSHTPYTIPVPVGALCDLDADSGVISFNFAMAE